MQPRILIALFAVMSASAGEVTIKAGGIELQLVRIPAGEFLMGSEKDTESPRHQVRVAAFDLAKTEVTVAQFRAFVKATGYKTDGEKENSAWVCRGPQQPGASWRSRGYWDTVEGANWRNPGFTQADDHPVVAVSWNDAMEFTKWLSRETRQEYRLPSEAEWEYAARAGSAGDAPPDLDVAAWHRENSDKGTHPVGAKQPNAWGLHDMLGNAWEWVADVWRSDYVGAPPDGSARLDGGSPFAMFKAGELRPLRGGGWCLETAEARFASRPPFGAAQRCNNSGFRVARTIPR
jgi:formylglycine-generating enzyme required for sulfatase activity